ncbi:Phosphoenolpyruvate:glucose-phosphotransferase regulator [Roseimaritima ulvae]|uniref:Phosphoenolpyruvate:glucose-phosphotransferase regulator n=2 Tax=Roseimaritima ulvae TaxID=980254 RepID=A0A5B9QW74_9BACT|nr:Phosphoenolpyruvate:glucose-phosphotransferase regulator [Roseimaritima ulvae]
MIMKYCLSRFPFALLLLLAAGPWAADAVAADDARTPRPQLQIINGSDQPVDIFWLDADGQRTPNGSLKPGQDTVIKTTLGHRFAVVGQRDGSEQVVISRLPVQGVRLDAAGRDGVPPFYSQSTSVNGFPIVASATVDPHALAEAKYLIEQMLALRPDVLKAMTDSGARLCIMAYNEFTTDLPEFARMGDRPHPDFPQLDGKDYWDARARGTGGSQTDPFCSVGEENLLGYPGDPYASESILIHEFAHSIHLRGLVNVDPTFDRRLQQTYRQAMQQGLWKGKYAGVNRFEYFAEGVQSWFDDNRENDHDHNHVNTRAELLEYDPGLAAICREVFGDTVLKYTKPATRLKDHLADYDPADAPTFRWPARLTRAKQAIRQHAQARDAQAGTHEDRKLAGWTVHVHKQLLAPDHRKATETALRLLNRQLDEIVREVPPPAVAELRKVPLWISPEYENVQPRAEYHPGAGWLKNNGRDPAMAKGVEFTNVRIFEAETRRMPNFALHELAHAYHDRVLPKGFGNPELKAAYERMKAGGLYERVERRNSNGETRIDRAYALTNPQEYFAEVSEAYFSTNDFFPYTRDELERHDPEVVKLLGELWGVQ